MIQRWRLALIAAILVSAGVVTWLALPAGPPLADSTPVSEPMPPADSGRWPVGIGKTTSDPEATRLMRRVEGRFRAGNRGVRLRIANEREDKERVIGRPDAVEIWGVHAGSDDGTDMLFVFTQPRWTRGTGLMLIDPWGPQTEDEMSYHMPSFNRFKNLPQSSLKVLVAGTCLTYEDAHGFLSTDKYEFAWAPRGDQQADGEAQVLAWPKTPQLAENLGYSSLVVSVDTALEMVRRIEYTGLSGELVKIYETHQPVEMDGAWLPGAARSEDLRHLVVSEVSFSYWPLVDRPPSGLYEKKIDKPLITRFFDHLTSQGITVELSEEDAEELTQDKAYREQ